MGAALGERNEWRIHLLCDGARSCRRRCAQLERENCGGLPKLGGHAHSWRLGHPAIAGRRPHQTCPARSYRLDLATEAPIDPTLSFALVHQGMGKTIPLRHHRSPARVSERWWLRGMEMGKI